MVSVEVCPQQKERLGRSIVGETIEPIDFAILRRELIKEGSPVTSVSDLGAYRALVTFESPGKANEAMSKEREVLGKFFAEFRMWSDEDWSQTRRIWLECYGVPPHAWSYDNIKRIGEEWGTVVCLDNTTKEGKSFSVARILIDTCVWLYIHGWVFLSVEGKGYDVFVKEVGKEVLSKQEMEVAENDIQMRAPLQGNIPDESKIQEARKDKGNWVNAVKGKDKAEFKYRDMGSVELKAKKPYKVTINSDSVIKDVGDRMEDSQGDTVAICDDRSSEEVIRQFKSNNKIKKKGPALRDGGNGSNTWEPNYTCQATRVEELRPNGDIQTSESSTMSPPPGFGHDAAEKDPTECAQIESTQEPEAVAETELSSNEDSSCDMNEVEDPCEEVAQTWQVGREMGLYISEEEDIMSVLEAKNKERDEKRKVKKRKKGRTKKVSQTSNKGAQSKLK